MNTFLLSTLMTLCCIYSKAQLPKGVYMSSTNSFRTNYFLEVEQDFVTLIGWETTTISNKDTVYFKSACKKDSVNRLTFTTFEFSKSQINQKNFQNFIANPDVRIEPFLLHNRFFNFKFVNNKILFLATKDLYDSRADKFEFVKIK